MSKIGLVIQREYTSKVKNKTFLLITFLTPFIMIAMMAVPLWLSTLKDSSAKKVGLVDYSGLYKDVLKNTDQFVFYNLENEDIKLNAGDEKAEGAYDAYIVINAPITKENNKISFISLKQIPVELRSYVEGNLEEYVYNQNLANSGVDNIKNIIENARVRINVDTIKRMDTGEEVSSSGEIAGVIGIFTTFLIYMFIFMYGTQVMNSVVEEKTNRIVEILVSSVSPVELMMGKILAIALVGLTQMMIWVVMIGAAVTYMGVAFGLTSKGVDPAQVAGMAQMAQMPVSGPAAEIFGVVTGFNWSLILGMFVIYFIGGYLLYSSMFAAVGAAVDSQADTQQFMLPITLPIIFALYAGIYSAQNPDGPLAFWCSLIPFTSPIVMMVRLPFDVPMWQILLSVGLLIVTFIGMVFISAKIYRVGILMYGKKTNYKELIKWIRYH
ncbi:MAG: ABC transporter permease [Bacteroidales bacterium]